jgi:hypothetical protein
VSREVVVIGDFFAGCRERVVLGTLVDANHRMFCTRR